MITPEQMAALHARAFAGQGRAWSDAEFRSLLDNPAVFVTGDKRCFALGRVITDEAELLTIATDPDHLRLGLARHCLQNYDAHAHRRGANTSFLEVAVDNLAATALYRAEGYLQAARRKEYYARAEGPAVDALILRKALTSRSL